MADAGTWQWLAGVHAQDCLLLRAVPAAVRLSLLFTLHGTVFSPCTCLVVHAGSQLASPLLG